MRVAVVPADHTGKHPCSLTELLSQLCHLGHLLATALHSVLHGHSFSVVKVASKLIVSLAADCLPKSSAHASKNTPFGTGITKECTPCDDHCGFEGWPSKCS